jgi:hypothetical protein
MVEGGWLIDLASFAEAITIADRLGNPLLLNEKAPRPARAA